MSLYINQKLFISLPIFSLNSLLEFGENLRLLQVQWPFDFFKIFFAFFVFSDDENNKKG